MPKFVVVYHGGPSSMSKEQGQQHMTEWRDWMRGLGDAVIDLGMPVGKSKTVSQNGVEDHGGSNPISGVTILQAKDFDAALEMVKGSPHVNIGGTIEISQAMDMEM